MVLGLQSRFSGEEDVYGDALESTAIHGQTECAKAIIGNLHYQSSFDPPGVNHIPLNRAYTAAARNGHVDVMRLLVNMRGSVSTENYIQTLEAASRNGHEEAVQELLRNGFRHDRNFASDEVAEIHKKASSLALSNGYEEVARMIQETDARIIQGPHYTLGWRRCAS